MQQQKLTIVLAAALLAALLVSACNSSQPAPPANEAAKQAPKETTPGDRVKWYQDCWSLFNDHKWDEFKKCYADNATSVQLGYGKPTVSGNDAIIAGSQDFAKSFPDGRGDGQLILINGNKIASLFILKGTNSGPLTGPEGKEAPATNKPFGLLFGHYIEIDPNTMKVTKEVGAMDGGTLAAQLGLAKNPARPVTDKGEASPKIVIAKNDETEMKNVEVDRAQIEAFNKHDAAAVDSYETDDFVLHDQTGPKDVNKKEASEGNKQFWKGFSDAKLTVTSIWGAGDYVVLIGNFDGTNDGDFAPMKLKKTGKKVSLPYMEIDRFEGGKFKEAWLIFDTAMFASQLGVK